MTTIDRRLPAGLLFAFVVGVSAAVAPAAADPDEDRPFRMGVYVYAYQMDKVAADEGRPLGQCVDRHFGLLAAHGVNAVYLGGAGPKTFDDYLAAADRHGIKLIPQLDFVYFRTGWKDSEMAAQARRAGEFIRKYRHHPAVLAWSVKEEVDHSEINELARYYAMIREYAPDAPLNLIHSNLGAARDAPVPDPAVIGTDRYGFWWEFSGGGYLASPQFALDWTRTEAAHYWTEAARRGADYMLVVTQGGLLSLRTPNTLIKCPDNATYPKTPTEREKLRSRALAYAETNRMGWRKVTTSEGDFYAAWKYYRLPENCLKALAWTSVLEGAKLFFVWSYSPPTQATLDAGDIDRLAVAQADKSNFVWWTMAGRPGLTNRHLAEFADAAREIRRYERIITRMVKRPDLAVETKEKFTFARAFQTPTQSGLFFVVHNANVGTWPEGSRYFFTEKDNISISDQGDLVGYQPAREPIDVHLTFAEGVLAAAGKTDGLFDLAAGREIKPQEGTYAVPVPPGSGTILFLGRRELADQWHSLVLPPTFPAAPQ